MFNIYEIYNSKWKVQPTDDWGLSFWDPSININSLKTFELKYIFATMCSITPILVGALFFKQLGFLMITSRSLLNLLRKSSNTSFVLWVKTWHSIMMIRVIVVFISFFDLSALKSDVFHEKMSIHTFWLLNVLEPHYIFMSSCGSKYFSLLNTWTRRH